MSKKHPKQTTTTDTMNDDPKTPQAPADERFAGRLNTELAQWERRHANVRKIAYGRLANHATDAQIEAAVTYLQTEHDATIAALQSIVDRRGKDVTPQERKPFQVVPGQPARVYTPKQITDIEA